METTRKSFEKKIGRTINMDATIHKLGRTLMERDEEIKRLKEELEEKDAHWNDWLNSSFGDELYPLSPSPEPDEFVEKVKKLIHPNEIAKLFGQESFELFSWDEMVKRAWADSKENARLKKVIDEFKADLRVHLHNDCPEEFYRNYIDK
jgi:uncharacterized small protein (DUF1192 family)